MFICTSDSIFGKGDTLDKAYDDYLDAAYKYDEDGAIPGKCAFFEVESPIKTQTKIIPISVIQQVKPTRSK